jgi:DNA-binding Xre family transcriptional regulator
MALTWKLREVLADRCGIHSATALGKLLEGTAGVKMSLESLSQQINGHPAAVRFQTIQAICTATGLKLSDFCEVSPDAPAICNTAKPLYSVTRKSGKARILGFPSPRDFYQPKRLKGNVR